MKTLELVLIIMLVCFWGSENLYSQTMSWDESYTTTVLFDDFSQNQLDLNQWSVEDNSYSFNGVIIDSSATVSINSGNLKLSVISCRDCSRAGETRDLAGGEIYSNESIQYGIFECSAKINISEASLPIFSFIGGNGNDCANGNYYASEVDIFQVVEPYIIPVELQQRVYHHHPDTDCKLKSTSVNINSEQIETSLNDFFDYYHTYKCVWTPNYIRYYVDGFLKHEVTNTGAECPTCNQNWFPTYSSNVHLCNKVGGNMYYTYYTSTYFDWVRVKEFFLAPEITVPSLICTTGTAVLDVDPAADSITWKLTPTNLFSGTKQGTGKTAAIAAASGANGQGKITYTFKMPSNEIFTAERTFWVGKPVLTNMTINGSLTFPSEVCKGKIDIFAAGLDANYTEPVTYIWSGSNVEITGSANSVWVKYTGSVNSYASVTVTVSGQCGQWSSHCTWSGLITNCGGDDETYRITPNETVLEDSTSFDESALLTSVSETETKYKLTLTPNPAHMETILKIECVSAEETFDENEAWDLEIYTQSQLLKNRKTKLKGQSTNITIAGWQEGVYVVRVKYGNIILQEKLLVK
jgi:beta-glucanase (GH16 family)